MQRTKIAFSFFNPSKRTLNLKKADEPTPSPAKKLKVEEKPQTVYDRFKQGDLIFGLNKHLDEVTEVLKTKGFHHTYANTLNTPVLDMIVNDKKKELDPEKKQHYDFLLGYRGYLIRPNGKPVPLVKDDLVVSAAYRRGCKLLLRYHKNIHFLLDDINPAQVCDKKLSGDGVTNSELRALYRAYREKGTLTNVSFYLNEVLLNKMPWDLPNFAPHFARYEQHLQNKAIKLAENSSMKLKK